MDKNSLIVIGIMAFLIIGMTAYIAYNGLVEREKEVYTNGANYGVNSLIQEVETKGFYEYYALDGNKTAIYSAPYVKQEFINALAAQKEEYLKFLREHDINAI